jgi:uncharacterized membrane protein
MPTRLQLLVTTVIIVLAIGLALMDASVIEQVIGLLGVFVLPGWLLTSVLFGIHSGLDQETRVILVLGLGVALVALELVALTAVGIKLSRESVALGGALISLLLVGMLMFRLPSDRTKLGSKSVLVTLLLSAVIVLVMYIFIPLHQPVGKESYTEFYVVPRRFEATGDQTSGVELVITSHEQKKTTYTVLCTDMVGSETLLTKSELEPESSLTVDLFVPPPQADSISKVRLSLYREEDDTPYRWVELVGEGCDLLPQPKA